MLAGLNISYATVVSSVSVGGASTFISVGTNKGMYRCSRVVVTVPLGA